MTPLQPETQDGVVIAWPIAARPDGYAQPAAVEALADATERELRRRRRDRAHDRALSAAMNRESEFRRPWPTRLQFVIAGAEPGWWLVALAALLVGLARAGGLI